MMAKPSNAQAKIIAAIQAGARLALDPKTGRYTITEMTGKTRRVDQRPVLVMIRDGILHQTLGGECLVN